ncbi:MAG: transcriptional repressor LexA, partial [Alphaproteobacteria bacterium]|nr:transcriptional repressor LexA [Alphaproteobacteria bacterium]
MLTRKQHELLLYINRRLADSGVSPSFEEMKEALGLKSKSGIHRLISGLEERGFIRRLPHRARALEVVKLPEETAAKGRPTKFSPTVIKGDFKTALPGMAVNDSGQAQELPLYGRIAAGTPIEALRDNANTISVPAGMLGLGEHYALEVAGDSMVEAGICDGDTVLIQRCDTADNGAIVVAL